MTQALPLESQQRSAALLLPCNRILSFGEDGIYPLPQLDQVFTLTRIYGVVPIGGRYDVVALSGYNGSAAAPGAVIEEIMATYVQKTAIR